MAILRCPACADGPILDDDGVPSCARCGGALLRSADADALFARAGARPSPVVDGRARRCAACGAATREVVAVAVHFDRCSACADVWFDAGEGAALVAQARAAGLQAFGIGRPWPVRALAAVVAWARHLDPVLVFIVAALVIGAGLVVADLAARGGLPPPTPCADHCACPRDHVCGAGACRIDACTSYDNWLKGAGCPHGYTCRRTGSGGRCERTAGAQAACR